MLLQSGGRLTLRSLKWPGGRNVAVVLSIACEAWSKGNVSAVSPMGNPLPSGIFDWNAHSYGMYGALTGVHRLGRKLSRLKIGADIFVSGMVGELFPQVVRQLRDDGHRMVAHGYAQNLFPAKLSSREDNRSIDLTTDILTSVTGERPKGWISPRATAGPETLERLASHGYRWHADALDADLPYVQGLVDGSLIAIPLGIEFNDLSHAMRFGRTPAQFVEIFDDALRGALTDAEDTVILDVLVHAHCYGRPGSAWSFEHIARRCQERDDVWLTNRNEIAEYFDLAVKSAGPDGVVISDAVSPPEFS